MKDYSKALDNEGWSEHYNMNSLNSVVAMITSGGVSVWSEELCRIIIEGDTCLEIGCGTGISSLWLAKHGRKATALDYTESSVALVSAASEKLGVNLNVVLYDATKELPFKEKSFDYAFQCGLLEHFGTEKQIELLKNWKKCCKYMISMIPNAASIPYRLGKQIMEEKGSWEYGLEIPKHSMAMEFTAAGITVEKEYSIGTDWAMRFLPERHYLKKCINKMKKQGINLDEYMQGYLLVTIGKCEV